MSKVYYSLVVLKDTKDICVCQNSVLKGSTFRQRNQPVLTSHGGFHEVTKFLKA